MAVRRKDRRTDGGSVLGQQRAAPMDRLLSVGPGTGTGCTTVISLLARNSKTTADMTLA
jgi:hypothetical protein